MSYRFFLAAVLGTFLTAALSTAAFSQSTYEQNTSSGTAGGYQQNTSSGTAAGYNTSTGNQTVIGSDHSTGGPTPSDYQQMQNIQQGFQQLRQSKQHP